MQEYYEKLCKKFPEITFNTGSSLMSGNENKVVINLSSECLKKMANDPEFAKKVEFNLTGAVPGQNILSTMLASHVRMVMATKYMTPTISSVSVKIGRASCRERV